MPAKLTNEQFIEKAKKIFPHISYENVRYIDTKTPVILKCKHGEFLQEPRSLLSKHITCTECYKEIYNKNYRASSANVIEYLKKFDNIIQPKELIFKTVNDYVDLECKIHGKFRIQVRYLKNSKYCCQKCANIEKTKNAYTSTRKKPDELATQIYDVHGDIYDTSKIIYKGINEKIEVICKKHGSFFPLASNFLLKGSGCPHCQKKISTEHDKVIKFLDNHNIHYEINKKSIIDNHELDIFISDRNLAIEINGLYWHSFLDRRYHVNKLELCENKGIHLIQIWDYEIHEKWDIISSRLKSYLGLNERIYARETICKVIDAKSSNIFMDENHLQGHDNCSVNIGLFYNDKLVSLMTFKKPRFNDKYDYELIRYASCTGINVVGGADKLFKYFLNNYNPKSIISYADRRFTNSSSSLYTKLGFELVSTSNPSYLYFKNKIRLSRYMCQKHKLIKILPTFNKEKSECENMLQNGFRQVYDCGNLVYVYNKVCETGA